jgi:hypothetical protein
MAMTAKHKLYRDDQITQSTHLDQITPNQITQSNNQMNQ